MRHHSRIAVLIAAAVLTHSACRGSQAAGAAAGGRGKGGPVLQVQTASVERRDVVYSVKALGSLEAEEMVQVTAQVPGAVSSVNFHEGDRVSAETVLVQIDPERYRLEAARAEAAFTKAEADARGAEQTFSRREQLFAQQLVAQEELNRARAERDALAGEAGASRAARDIALQNLRHSAVRAPQAGVLDTKAVSTGQFVTTGTVLATLVDTSRLRLRFKVSDGESLRARNGQQVNFRVGALGARDFPAKIYHVGEVADVRTRQVEVLAWVKNPGELKPGFFAEVQLATDTRQAALVVPEGAIQASEKGFVAYVVTDGKARLRTVEVGLRTGDGLVEVVTGLEAGQRVVTLGSDRLVDGVAIEEAGGGAPVKVAR